MPEDLQILAPTWLMVQSYILPLAGEFILPSGPMQFISYPMWLLLHYCSIMCGIVLYRRFDKPAVDGFLTTGNNTLVRDCLDHPTVIKTTTKMTKMMMKFKTRTKSLVTATTS